MSSAALLLTDVTRNLPGGGEDRPGQIEMTELVASAVARRETTLIEAGTGTGKSFAYLTPLIAADCRSVVATATIALQGQLVAHDVPRVAESLGREVTVELLKGRGNYLCRQRLDELQRADRTEQLDLLRGRNPGSHLDALAEWAEAPVRGDRGDRRQRGDRQRGGTAPAAGQLAPDFELPLVGDDQTTVKLSSFAGVKPVALIFGSYT